MRLQKIWYAIKIVLNRKLADSIGNKDSLDGGRVTERTDDVSQPSRECWLPEQGILIKTTAITIHPIALRTGEECV